MSSTPQKVKLVAFCCVGRFQNYLLHRLRERHDLAGVVFCQPITTAVPGRRRLQHLLGYLNPLKLARYTLSRLVLPRYEAETERRLAMVYPEFIKRQSPPADLHAITVEDINDPAVIDFVRQLGAEMICVNGTNLIREPLLSIGSALPYGMLNLHTGLSPYARGGNCNLFVLLEQQPQLVGATVHFIDPGIDSGDIVQSLRPDLAADDPYEYIEAKAFICGIDALVSAVDKIANGKALRVKQWQSGKLFLKRTGYQYEPYCRVRANREIRNGLIERYLRARAEIDNKLTLIG